MSEKTQLPPPSSGSKSVNFHKSSTKLQHFPTGSLAVAEAAKLLNKSDMTVTRWCQSGKLPASELSYGAKVTYRISPLAVELLKAELDKKAESKLKKAPSLTREHSELIPAWVSSLEAGTLTGRVYSPLSIEDYEGHVKKFLAEHGSVNFQTLNTALENCGGKYGKRSKLYKAVVCFAKFLRREGLLPEQFFQEIKPLFPKRHKEPKRVTVSEGGLLALLEHCKKPIETALLIVLTSTGLRASELCNLCLSDISLERRVFTASNRKAGKNSKLGLTAMAVSAIKTYRDSLPTWVDAPNLFVDEQGQPLTRMAIYNRLKRLGQRAGVPVHPHALRRAFVTINANKGRPLQMLQIACGHSSIKTTMDYCRTTEQEVIDAMKDW